MTETDSGATADTGGASKPTKDELDREPSGIAGNSAEGEEPSPAGRDGGEGSSADDQAAIDLDTVRDRAS